MNMCAPCVIARHINGISLNDYEYVFDGDGDVKVFQNKNEAINFLYKEGVNEEDMHHLHFLNYSKLQSGVYEEMNGW